MLNETEVNFSRKDFTTVQSKLATFPEIALEGEFTCGWYGTVVSEERGSFCIVNADSPLFDYIGDYLRIRHAHSTQPATTAVVGGVSASSIVATNDTFVRSISVYCLESHGIPYDLALTRRAYLALAPLWTPYLSVRVGQVLDGYDGTP